MGKYHVGDRWADQDGVEWILFWTNGEDEVRACNKLGRSDVFRYGRSLSGLKLTRLISSERWIPFAEMMPEDAHQETRTILVRDPKRKADDSRERLVVPVSDQFGHWCWLESHQDDGVEDMIAHGYVEWKYLQPPEAP